MTSRDWYRDGQGWLCYYCPKTTADMILLGVDTMYMNDSKNVTGNRCPITVDIPKIETEPTKETAQNE